MFKASPLEFRFRYLLHCVIFILGFTTPWDYAIHVDPPGPNAHVWGILAAQLSRLGMPNIVDAFNLLLALAILCAFAGAWLRTWGAAYLGTDVVNSHRMHTEQISPAGTAWSGVIADGPFRHVRNPLYLGTFLHTLALALLMPASGAIFCIVAIGLLQLRLMLAEEPFLLEKLGAPYAAYVALVPRVVPSLRTRVAAGGLVPRWPQAFLGEIYMWAVAGAFAFFGWRYDAWLLTQGVIVAVGLSLVVRAFMPKAA